MIILIASLLVALLCGCNTSQQQQEITLWHFWSEPRQREVLDSLIAVYEQHHAHIRIKPTPLSWTDGYTKLLLAFNSSTPPDIVHLGMDWFAEFNNQHVLAPVTGPVQYTPQGVLWVVNARTFVRHNGSTTKFEWGLCASDAHNVIKRTLPMLWQYGAPEFFGSLPVYKTIDTNLVNALWTVRGLVHDGAVVDNSRGLDERFARGEIHNLLTGSWIVNMVSGSSLAAMEVRPAPSVLNGDVLAITSASDVHGAAQNFIQWLTSYQQAKTFCLNVPDAGFPASDSVFGDPDFSVSLLQSGFLQTIRLSKPLPVTPHLLAIEPIIERLIEQCYSAATKQDVHAWVMQAKAAVRNIEQSPAH